MDNLKMSLVSVITLLLVSSCKCSGVDDVVNILKKAGKYHIFSTLVEASNVVNSDEFGDGITVFAPNDQAFVDSRNFQSLPAVWKINVIANHILCAYIPLGMLQAFNNPIQPTLTTRWYGPGYFLLNISKLNASSPIRVESSLVSGRVTEILYQRKRMAVFGVSKLLLPKEMFDKKDKL